MRQASHNSLRETVSPVIKRAVLCVSWPSFNAWLEQMDVVIVHRVAAQRERDIHSLTYIRS